MGFDIENDYKNAKNTINALKTFTEANSSYKKITEDKGDGAEDAIKNTKEQLNNAKKNVKRWAKKIKNTLDNLLDINNILAGKGNNSLRYIKNTFVKVLKFIEPILQEILLEEAINAVGCDLDQTYDERDIYIKVSSLDITGLLKLDPLTDPGNCLYEKKEIDVQTPKFSMNRELYNRIQNTNPFSQEYGGRFYKGASGQDLFDIQFVQTNNFGVTGPWYKITLKNRIDGPNRIKQFLIDYYQSISIIDFSTIIANIMNALSGCISISAKLGLNQNEEQTKFSLFIQRILGLCFDNVTEIDVSGNAKVGEQDGIDESFYEFDELDLIQIQETVNNILNGVTELEECNNIKLNVNTESLINGLKQLREVPDDDLVDETNKITDAFANNQEANGFGFQGDLKITIDLNFIKKIAEGLVVSLLSPKILLPIFVMVESLGQLVTSSINSIMQFAKNFGKFLQNLISRIGAIFVKKLFEIISKDIKQLLQSIIKDLAKEKSNILLTIILKLIQVSIVIAEFVRDWRRCKSVIDEILWLLKIATSGIKIPGFEGKIPFPLLLFSQFLDGKSATREFIGSIEEMQRLGIPTGAMPDGSPNLDMLKMFGQLKASQNENAENGVTEISLPLIPVSPTRTTGLLKIYGKSL